MKRKAAPTRGAKAIATEDKCPLTGGEVITFLYPKHPFHGVSGPLEPHFGRVTEVRDLHVDLLSETEIDENPLLLRSRFLVTYVAPDNVHTSSCFTDFMRHLQILTPGLMTSRPANRW